MDRLHRQASAVPVALLAAALGVVIVVLGVLGRLEDQGAPLSLFDLDGEGKPPAAVSALLLGSTSLACLLVRRIDATSPRRWLVLAGFFAFMALDEALTLHETLSKLTGVGWPTLYSPVVVFGGVAWLLVLARLRTFRLPCALWVAGAAAWATAQLLEILESGPGGRVPNYSVYATFEECLELIGTSCWLLALLLVLRGSRRGAAGAPESTNPHRWAVTSTIATRRS